FVAAVQLRRKQPNVKRGYTAPALTFLCTVGFLASAAAIIIGFVPPSQFENGSTGAYVAVILGGTFLIGLLPPWLFLRLRKPDWAQPEAAETATCPPPPPSRRMRPTRPPRTPSTAGCCGSAASSRWCWRSSASSPTAPAVTTARRSRRRRR